MDDIYYMRIALQEADTALAEGNAPVGAVVVHRDKVVGRGHNTKTTNRSGIAHAELAALQQAIPALGRHPDEAVLYTTLEPCAMCLAAIAFAGIERVVFGSRDPLGGGVEIFQGHPYYENIMPKVSGGVLKQECDCLLDTVPIKHLGNP